MGRVPASPVNAGQCRDARGASPGARGTARSATRPRSGDLAPASGQDNAAQLPSCAGICAVRRTPVPTGFMAGCPRPDRSSGPGAAQRPSITPAMIYGSCDHRVPAAEGRRSGMGRREDEDRCRHQGGEPGDDAVYVLRAPSPAWTSSPRRAVTPWRGCDPTRSGLVPLDLVAACLAAWALAARLWTLRRRPRPIRRPCATLDGRPCCCWGGAAAAARAAPPLASSPSGSRRLWPPGPAGYAAAGWPTRSAGSFAPGDPRLRVVLAPPRRRATRRAAPRARRAARHPRDGEAPDAATGSSATQPGRLGLRRLGSDAGRRTGPPTRGPRAPRRGASPLATGGVTDATTNARCAMGARPRSLSRADGSPGAGMAARRRRRRRRVASGHAMRL